jgi:hypothetical protein
MVNLKRQLIKKIIGLASFGALLVAVVFGFAAKGTNFKINQDNQSSARENNQLEEQLAPINNERPEEVETSLFVEEYNEIGTMECMSVGCGGFF